VKEKYGILKRYLIWVGKDPFSRGVTPYFGGSLILNIVLLFVLPNDVVPILERLTGESVILSMLILLSPWILGALAGMVIAQISSFCTKSTNPSTRLYRLVDQKVTKVYQKGETVWRWPGTLIEVVEPHIVQEQFALRIVKTRIHNGAEQIVRICCTVKLQKADPVSQGLGSDYFNPQEICENVLQKGFEGIQHYLTSTIYGELKGIWPWYRLPETLPTTKEGYESLRRKLQKGLENRNFFDGLAAEFSTVMWISPQIVDIRY